MANSKSAVSKSPDKSSNQQKQHSAPFYISSTLFHNRRLKKKRSKWATESKETLKITKITSGVSFPSVAQLPNRKRKSTKTDFNQRRQPLPADITIDLLSDDDEDTAAAAPPSKAPKINSVASLSPAQPEFQHFYVCPTAGNTEHSRVPNITLIPLQNLTSPPAAHLRPRGAIKRKRKSQQPQRHAQPTIVNNESIILTDDSDTEATSSTAVAATAPPALVYHTPPAQPPPPQKIVIASAQVDEEVTVSIVPRSSTAGSCHAKSRCTATDKEALFPMLPDETTVHTVIANRIYELSLTKLREGLASCGISEFADSQQKPQKGGRQKIQTYAPPPEVVSPPQQAPISLKLSSDLSISLISDDEEDAVEAHRRAHKLLQAQPQLSVQQVPLPHGMAVVGINNNGRQPPPRRRKLG